MELNPILTSNKDYERRVCQSIDRGSKIDRWWKVAIGMKLKHDLPKQPWKDEPFNMTIENCIQLIESTFKDVCGDSFVSVKKHKLKNKKDDELYVISLSNFSVIIGFTYTYRSHLVRSLIVYFFDSYYTIDFYWNHTIEEFAKWLLLQNQEMPAFRQDWEAHCLEMRKRIMLGKVDVSAVKALIDDRLADKAKDCKIISDFTNEGGYLEVSCPSPEVCFRIPATYTNWHEVVSLFTDVVKSQTE